MTSIMRHYDHVYENGNSNQEHIHETSANVYMFLACVLVYLSYLLYYAIFNHTSCETAFRNQNMPVAIAFHTIT